MTFTTRVAVLKLKRQCAGKLLNKAYLTRLRFFVAELLEPSSSSFLRFIDEEASEGAGSGSLTGTIRLKSEIESRWDSEIILDANI
jgi:hypothetical protein